MERKVTKLEACHLEVEVVVDEESWKKAQDKAFKKLAANLTVAGFRKGKAPDAVARKHIDQMKMIDEAINSLLPTVYREVLEEEKIQPFAQPKVDVSSITDKNITLKFTIVTSPEVELGKYKGLKIGKEEVTVSDKDVEEAIDSLRSQSASLVLKEDKAALGDTVVIDFAGSIDGVAFDGGSAQSYSLELGSNSFIPGFEDQLVGAKAGDHVDVNVTFPEKYGAPELAGKAAVFACDVHEVKEKKYPELDEDFVKELGIPNVETIEALKENKKQELLERKQREARNAYFSKLYDEIAKTSKVEIPEEMIDEQVASSRKDFENRMAQSGLTLEQYLGYVGQSEEEYMAKLKKDNTRDITNYFILEAIAAKEGFELSDEEVEFEMAKLAETHNTPLEEVKKILAPQLAQFKNNLKMSKTEDFLYENND